MQYSKWSGVVRTATFGQLIQNFINHNSTNSLLQSSIRCALQENIRYSSPVYQMFVHRSRRIRMLIAKWLLIHDNAMFVLFFLCEQYPCSSNEESETLRGTVEFILAALWSMWWSRRENLDRKAEKYARVVAIFCSFSHEPLSPDVGAQNFPDSEVGKVCSWRKPLRRHRRKAQLSSPQY